MPNRNTAQLSCVAQARINLIIVDVVGQTTPVNVTQYQEVRCAHSLSSWRDDCLYHVSRATSGPLMSQMDEETAMMARLGLPITFLSSVGGQKAAQSGGAIKSGPAQKTAPAARPAPAVPQKPSVAPTKPRPASTLSSLAAYGDSDESASDSEAGGFGPQPAAAGAGPAASVASASASAAADADDVDAPIEQARQRARLAESSASSAGGNLPPSATVALPPPAPLPAAPVQLAESSSGTLHLYSHICF
jgi:hypothetical protein